MCHRMRSIVDVSCSSSVGSRLPRRMARPDTKRAICPPCTLLFCTAQMDSMPCHRCPAFLAWALHRRTDILSGCLRRPLLRPCLAWLYAFCTDHPVTRAPVGKLTLSSMCRPTAFRTTMFVAFLIHATSHTPLIRVSTRSPF